MRLPTADIALIDRAAKQQGRSRTDFMRAAAVRAAEEVLLDSSFVRMGPEAFDEFARLVAEPGEAVPELIRVLVRPAPWDSNSSHD